MAIKLIQRECEDYKKIIFNLGCYSQDLDFEKKRSVEKLKDIYIDARGYSKNVAEILGSAYVEDKIILISPSQRDTEIYNPEYSFLPFIIPTAHKLKEKTPLPLFGEMKIEIAKKGFDVVVYFYTILGEVRKLRDLKKRVEAIDLDPECILDDNYICALLKEASVLNKLYKNISHFDAESFKIHYNINSFKYNNLETYFLNNGNPLAVTLESAWLPKKINGNIDTTTKNTALESLLHNKYAEVDFFAVRKKMMEIEEPIVKTKMFKDYLDEKDKVAKFYGIPKHRTNEEKNFFHSPTIFDHFRILSTQKIANSLPKEWHTFNNLLNGNFSGISQDTKKNFLKASEDDPLLIELINILKNQKNGN